MSATISDWLLLWKKEIQSSSMIIFKIFPFLNFFFTYNYYMRQEQPVVCIIIIIIFSCI